MNNTQLQQVLAHLKQSNTIAQSEAINHFNCFRLSDVILRLRKAGHDIITHREPNNASTGTHARYEYRRVER